MAWELLFDPAFSTHLALLLSSLCIAFVLGWALSRESTKGNSISSRSPRGEDRYEGERDVEGRRSGKGLMIYANGSTYEGDWYKDKPWGKGKARSVNGDVYDGEWMDGKRANKGECQYVDGSCFIGNFHDGKKQGRGVLTFPSLESVQGYWEQGELIEAVMRSQTYIYEGQVQNLKPHGEGHMIFLSSGLDNNRGSAPSSPKRGDPLNDLVRESARQGDEYRGWWQDGLMHGHGVYHFCENNSYYEGMFKDNLLHGHGRLSVVHASSEVDHDEDEEETAAAAEGRLENGGRLVSSFEGEFYEGVPATKGLYRSWLGSEYEGDLELLFKETDGTFSPHKNKEAVDRVFTSKERIASLASSAKKLFMRTPELDEDEVEEVELASDAVALSSQTDGMRVEEDSKGNATPQLTREERLLQKGRGKASSLTKVWDDKLAFMHAHGKGTMTYPNDDKYSGDFKNNLRHGQGKLVYADSKEGVYEGSFEHDLPHGEGKIIVHVPGQGEKVYTGEMVQGQRSGIGTLYFPSGATYAGQWASDTFWGTGRYRFANGDVYSGAFMSGRRTGVGRMEYANGNSFQGQWQDDRRVKGQYNYKNGNIYTGEYRNNAMEGIGRFQWADGSSYEGGWAADKAEGIGRFTKPGSGGYVYEGGWKANKKDTGDDGELARVLYNNGDEFQGQFMRGKMTGEGTLVGKDGKEQRGQFIDGVFQG